MGTVWRYQVIGWFMVISFTGRFCCEATDVSYMIGFMEINHKSLEAVDLSTTIVNAGNGSAAVTLAYHSGQIDMFLLESNSFQILNMSAALLNTGSTKGTKGIRVNSNETVSVVGISRIDFGLLSSMDGYNGIEYSSLGTEYFAVTVNRSSEILIIGITTNTSVTIKLRIVGKSATYEGITYNDTDIIHEFVDEFETIQIQGKGDLTGTAITATHPISVFSGNKWIGFAKGSTEGSYLVEQLPPLKHWGTEYVLHPPGEFGYVFTIVGGYNDTYVYINCSDGQSEYIHLNESGDSYAVDKTVNISICVVAANRSVLVSMLTAMPGIKDPSMIMIQPLQSQQEYVFYVPQNVSSAEIVLLTTDNPGQIYLDTNPILPDFVSIGKDMFWVVVAVGEGIHVLNAPNSSIAVSGYLHVTRALGNSFEAFGFPLMPYNYRNHQPICTDSSSSPPPTTLTDSTTSLTTQPNSCEPCNCYTPFTDEQLTERIKDLRQQLVVKQTETNRYLRSKTSASDDRPSSAACGFVAGTMLAIVGGSVLVLDIGRLITYLKSI